VLSLTIAGFLRGRGFFYDPFGDQVDRALSRTVMPTRKAGTSATFARMPDMAGHAQRWVTSPATRQHMARRGRDALVSFTPQAMSWDRANRVEWRARCVVVCVGGGVSVDGTVGGRLGEMGSAVRCHHLVILNATSACVVFLSNTGSCGRPLMVCLVCVFVCGAVMWCVGVVAEGVPAC